MHYAVKIHISENVNKDPIRESAFKCLSCQITHRVSVNQVSCKVTHNSVLNYISTFTEKKKRTFALCNLQFFSSIPIEPRRSLKGEVMVLLTKILAFSAHQSFWRKQKGGFNSQPVARGTQYPHASRTVHTHIPAMRSPGAYIRQGLVVRSQ